MNPALQLARRGGNVRRYHVMPVIGEQTNAAHTFHMLVLLDLMMPEGPSPALTRAVLYHDVAEFVTGDSPWTAKRFSPLLRAELHRMEAGALVPLGLPVTTDLPPGDQCWFRLVDALECSYFAIDQAEMGNRSMGNVFWNGMGVTSTEYTALRIDPAHDAVRPVMDHLRAEAHRLGLFKHDNNP